MSEEFLTDHGFAPDVMLQYSDESFLIVFRNCKKDEESFREGMEGLLSCLREELDIPACVYVGEKFRNGQDERAGRRPCAG